MTKRSKSGLAALTPAKARLLGTLVFGFLLFVFFICVFIFAPPELPEFKQRMLAVACALLSGLFAFFLTGEISLIIRPAKSKLGDFGIKASGGVAVFAVVLWWWLSPLAPIKLEKRLEKVEGEQKSLGDNFGTLAEAIAIKMPTRSDDGLPMLPQRFLQLARQTSTNASGQWHLVLKAIVEKRPDETLKLLDQAAQSANDDDLATICRLRGQIEIYAGRFALAVNWFDKALAHNPGNADLLNEKGVALIYDGRFEDALPHLTNAVRVITSALGKHHADVGRALNNLAAVYQHLGRLSEAETNYLAALAIFEPRNDKDSSDLPNCLNNLASLHKDQGNLDKAVDTYQLAIGKLESSDARLGVIYMNLAALHAELNRTSEANTCYDRARKILENTPGKELDLATTLNNWASLHAMNGNFADSEKLYQRALTIRTSQLGPTAPVVAESYNNLAELQMKRNRFETAEPLLKQALTICRKNGRTNDKSAAVYFKNLGTVYRELGHYAEAEENYKTALAIRTNLFGSINSSVAMSLHDLAVLYSKQQRTEDALQCLRHGLTVLDQLPNRDDALITRNREEIAFLEGSIGRSRP
jgi:tetratricopeptide (TPR) repeat protein